MACSNCAIASLQGPAGADATPRPKVALTIKTAVARRFMSLLQRLIEREDRQSDLDSSQSARSVIASEPVPELPRPLFRCTKMPPAGLKWENSFLVCGRRKDVCSSVRRTRHDPSLRSGHPGRSLRNRAPFHPSHSIRQSRSLGRRLSRRLSRRISRWLSRTCLSCGSAGTGPFPGTVRRFSNRTFPRTALRARPDVAMVRRVRSVLL
jgi:hypothetical protein